MIENFLSITLAWISVITMFLFFLIFLFLLIFEAEKIRLKMVALPEYKSSWVFWVKSYKPFKWWHFYRRGAFIYLINPVVISKKQQETSIAAKKIVEIIPSHDKALYKITIYAGLLFFIAGTISYFLH